MRCKKIVVIVIGVITLNVVKAQQADTLTLGLEKCHNIFIEQNLQLLSKQYDISPTAHRRKAEA